MRLLATGKLALSTGFDGAQMQRRLVAWRAGGESINSLLLQGGDLQRARARGWVGTNPYAANASASFASHAVGCGIKPSSLVEDAPWERPFALAGDRTIRPVRCARPSETSCWKISLA